MNLVEIKNDQPVASSLQVAENFEKRHSHVLEAIEKKIHSTENSVEYQNMFLEGIYRDSSGKENKLYYMNRDGWTFIAMGFNGKKADTFKLKYIAQFNKMEQELKQPKILPKTYSEALRLAADLAEENEKLKAQLNQPDFEKGLVEQLDDVLYTTEEIAKEFGYLGKAGTYKFNQLLWEKRLIYPRKHRNKILWHLYSTHKKKGLKDLSTLASSQKWTEKGKTYIEKMLEDWEG